MTINIQDKIESDQSKCLYYQYMVYYSLIASFDKQNATLKNCITQIESSKLLLGDRLGKGASGTVFRADYLGEQVAVKVMVNQTPNTSLFEEIRVFSKLRHKFVVSFRGI
jgi:hypothetical protein